MSADGPFYEAILRGIGAPSTPNTTLFLQAWRQAEGTRATYNPLSTTWDGPGSTVYNSHGVRNYPSPKAGVDATVKTLLLPRFSRIADALRQDQTPAQIASALVASRWGTGPLVTRVLNGYAAGASPKPPPIATVATAPPMSSLDVVAPQAPAPRAAPPKARVRWPYWAAAGMFALVGGSALWSLLTDRRR